MSKANKTNVAFGLVRAVLRVLLGTIGLLLSAKTAKVSNNDCEYSYSNHGYDDKNRDGRYGSSEVDNE